METPKANNKIRNMPPAVIQKRYFNTLFLIDDYISTPTIIKTRRVTPIIKDDDDLSTPKIKVNDIYKTPMKSKNKHMSPPPIKKK